LIDEEALLIGGLGVVESSDIELKELSGFGLQFDESEAVAFSEDGEGFLLGVEVVQVKVATSLALAPESKRRWRRA